MNKERKDYIDMARGIAILLMVIGHTVDNTVLNTFIYSFHVPIFFVLSGMLWKEREMKLNIKRWVQTLLVPYVVVAVILCCFYRLYNWISGNGLVGPGLLDIVLGLSVPSLSWEGIQAFGPVWFLVCMFSGKVIFELVLKIISKENMVLLTVAIACLVLGGTVISGIMILPWSIDAALVSLLFSYVGWLLRDERFPRLMSDVKLRSWLVIGCGILWIAEMLCGSMDLAWRSYPMWPLCIFGATGGSIIVIVICYLARDISGLNRFLAFWGKNSMTVLCIHSLEKVCFPWGRFCSLLHIPETEIILVLGKLLMIGVAVLAWTKIKKYSKSHIK